MEIKAMVDEVLKNYFLGDGCYEAINQVKRKYKISGKQASERMFEELRGDFS